jgi:protein phosphatase
MGGYLPKPVTSKLIERKGNEYFRCTISSLNGYRENMEDGHAIDLQDTYAFFGVFDGHVDANCSLYLGANFPQAIRDAKPPMSDEALSQLTLAIDQKFVDQNKSSGSTGTYFICQNPSEGKYLLQVGNVGDSRVLVGRDGKAISLTTDHKPGLPEEKARIEQNGGFVANDRVDGNLAVSRAFGDAEYKSGTGNQLQQKVIALPEIRHFECVAGDFALLCCDGVFEGQFSNEQVVTFVTEQLQQSQDLAKIASAVCEEAINRGSRDNITCMIVQFKDGRDLAALPHEEFIPGPFNAHKDKPFRTAYANMAKFANLSMAQALAMRYRFIVKRLDEMREELGLDKGEGKTLPAAYTQLEEERKVLSGKSGSPPSDESAQTAWFEKWLQEEVGADSDDEDGTRRIAVDQSTFEQLQAMQNQMGKVPLPLLLELMGQSPMAGAAAIDADDE